MVVSAKLDKFNARTVIRPGNRKGRDMKHKVKFIILLAMLWPASAVIAQTQDSGMESALETITVTARKVKADKQDIPAAVSVFDGYTLEDTAQTNLGDVTMNAPNISFTRSDSHTFQYTFRGIGGTVNMNKVYYVNVDDVAVPYVATDTLLDVERIELLRGGQGALYGGNTHTGLINVITRDPEFSDFNAQTQMSVEKYGRYRFEGIMDGKVSDKTACRIALAYEKTDGYIDNTYYDRDDTNDSDQFTGRAKFVYLPGTDNKFTLSIYGDRFDSSFDSYSQTLGYETQNDETGENTGSIISPTLKWEHEFGGNTKLTSISNYTHSTYSFLQDWDFSSWDLAVGEYEETINIFSQEFKISGGDKSSLQWLAGVFARYQHQDNQCSSSYGSAAAAYGMDGTWDMEDSTVETRNLAGYGQLIYHPMPRLELTCALRLDYEQKELEWENESTTGNEMTAFNADEDWVAISPSASAAWNLTMEQKIYVMASRGFKAGDYNYVMPVAAVAGSDPVDPEYTMTYEAGYKSRHFNNRLELNAALFYVDWTDLQVDVPIRGTSFFEKVNAADAHSSGVELEVKFRPMAGWTIFSSAGYMFEYEFDTFTRNAVDYSGNKLPYTNEFTISLGSILHTKSGFFLGMDAAFRGDYYLLEDNTERQDGFIMLNAKAGYAWEKWEISVYGRNLLDELYAVYAYNGAFMAGEPLTVGIMAKYKF